MTQQEAISLYETSWWKSRDATEIALFFFFEAEGRLCLPFDVLQSSVETALGRPVWTHEFGSVGSEQIKRELLHEKPAPTFGEILALLGNRTGSKFPPETQ